MIILFTSKAPIWTEYFLEIVLINKLVLIFCMCIVDSHALNWNRQVNFNDIEEHNQFQLGALPVTSYFIYPVLESSRPISTVINNNIIKLHPVKIYWTRSHKRGMTSYFFYYFQDYINMK